MTIKREPLAETTYRVWVEKHESGWVTVTALSEDAARDEARYLADHPALCHWHPDAIQSTACEVEKIDG